MHQIGITSNPIIAEVDLEKISSQVMENLIYKPISDFPEMIEQMTISSTLPIGEIMEKIKSVNGLINLITYLDSFNDNHSFKITFSSPSKNLTQTEVNDIKDKIKTLFA